MLAPAVALEITTDWVDEYVPLPGWKVGVATWEAELVPNREPQESASEPRVTAIARAGMWFRIPQS